MLRTRRGLAILVACLAAVVGIGAYVVSRAELVPWQRAEADGRTVSVTYVGGECDDWAWTDVDEQSDAVTITVHVMDLGASCSDVGVQRMIDVELAEPLGDREVIDGACGQPKYEDYLVC